MPFKLYAEKIAEYIKSKRERGDYDEAWRNDEKKKTLVNSRTALSADSYPQAMPAVILLPRLGWIEF